MAELVEWFRQVQIGLDVTPYEFAGVGLGLLLVLRTNAGYDRWWEARKLWGGIVNKSRNLVIGALSYGPDDPEWRGKMVRWVAVFPHIARCSLRGEAPSPEVVSLVGQDAASQIEAADHMPGFVALKISGLLQQACLQLEMDRFAFLQVDKERATLIDHIGGCERILKTPLPLVYAIKIRRFITLFLLTLPLALLHQTDKNWMIPLITMFVTYPLISLDQIGIELQNPFSNSNLSHLPLDEISTTIEKNVWGLLEASQESTENIS
jgi:ion channel-forming bestrophin family protein